MTADISLPDYLAMLNIAYDWADSYDTKDWARLRTLLAPSVWLECPAGGPSRKDLSPDEYVEIISGKALLGDKQMVTQHLLGASKFERLEDGSVRAWYQCRAAHQRYADEALTSVQSKGHGHGTVQHRYRKIDGTWKLEGSESTLQWAEDQLFETITGGKPEDK